MTVRVLVILLLTVFYVAAQDYSYDDQERWPDSCRGSSQSPIAIHHRETIKTFFEEWNVSDGFYQHKHATVINTGHTIQIDFVEDSDPVIISGGGLNGEYIFQQMHFHWGSEHIVHRERYPLEGHFVFYNRRHLTFEEALTVPGGIAVLAVLYQKAPVANFAFIPIFPHAKEVAHAVNQPFRLESPIVLNDFFPTHTTKFYRYNGSLTSPNCNEVVVWTVFASPSHITKKLVGAISRIYDASGNLVKKNYREVQDLNGREILFGCIEH